MTKKNKPLETIVSFEGFEHRMYLDHEETILTPRLREKGYYLIIFVDGEADNLGPLRRLCRCFDSHGNQCEFWYE
jgi:hypothetical protein